MPTVIIVYASMTGNTEEMAEAVAEGVREAGVDPVVKSVLDANAGELAEYDAVILGAYTWGDGELPDEFLDFYEEMDEIDLSGRKSAVFGSADSAYPQFGAAVDTLLEKLRERGAENVLEGMKVELGPSDSEKQECREFGKRFVGFLG
ncbi:flavodoxin [Paenibacillus tarimensis]